MLKHVLVVLCCLVTANVWGQEEHLSKLFEVHSKFAALGSAEAQYKLGQMYEEGQGTQADYAKAREWYEKAATQGYDKAKQRLETWDEKAIRADSDAAAREAALAQQRAAEERARQEAAAAQQRVAEEKARQEAAAAQKRAAEEKARQEAATAQKRAAEEKARQTAVAAQKRAAEEKARQEAAAAEKRAAEEKARQEVAAAPKVVGDVNAQQASSPPSLSDAARGNATPSAAKAESFDTDPCNTPAARFMSTCRDKK